MSDLKSSDYNLDLSLMIQEEEKQFLTGKIYIHFEHVFFFYDKKLFPEFLNDIGLTDQMILDKCLSKKMQRTILVNQDSINSMKSNIDPVLIKPYSATFKDSSGMVFNITDFLLNDYETSLVLGFNYFKITDISGVRYRTLEYIDIIKSFEINIDIGIYNANYINSGSSLGIENIKESNFNLNVIKELVPYKSDYEKTYLFDSSYKSSLDILKNTINNKALCIYKMDKVMDYQFLDFTKFKDTFSNKNFKNKDILIYYINPQDSDIVYSIIRNETTTTEITSLSISKEEYISFYIYLKNEILKLKDAFILLNDYNDYIKFHLNMTSMTLKPLQNLAEYKTTTDIILPKITWLEDIR